MNKGQKRDLGCNKLAYMPMVWEGEKVIGCVSYKGEGKDERGKEFTE